MFRQFETLDLAKETRIAAVGILRICFVNEKKTIRDWHWTEIIVIPFATFIRDFALLCNLRQHFLNDGKQKFGLT